MNANSATTRFVSTLNAVGNRVRKTISDSSTSARGLGDLNVRIFSLGRISDLNVCISNTSRVGNRVRVVGNNNTTLAHRGVVTSITRGFVYVTSTSGRISVLNGFPLPMRIVPVTHDTITHRLIGLNNHPRCHRNIIASGNGIVLSIRNVRVLSPVTVRGTVGTVPNIIAINLFTGHNTSITLVNAPSNIGAVIG